MRGWRISSNFFRAEDVFDFGQGRLARFNKLTSDKVRIHHRKAALVEQIGGGGFPHADSTG